MPVTKKRKLSKFYGLAFRILVVVSFGIVAFYQHGIYNHKQKPGFSKGLIADINEMVNSTSNSAATATSPTTNIGINVTTATSPTTSNGNNVESKSEVSELSSDHNVDPTAVEDSTEGQIHWVYRECIQQVKKNKLSSSLDPKRKFAYGFLIAGCDPANPAYLGYIVNIIVAKELLKMSGSSQDVIVLIRMYQKSNETKLPDEHEALLTKSGIIFKYLPKVLTDNFHTAMMDKFRFLEFDEYDRILYLDADVMPINNLDYMFYFSTKDNPDLAENAVIAYNNEPANGGFFMLTPNKKDFVEVQKIIERRELEGYDFNTTTGFGHQIKPPDHWESLTSYVKETHNKDNNDNDQVLWDFYGAFTDQGLLYHWTKYVKNKLSIINGDKVQTWGSDEHGELKMISERPGKEVFINIPRHCKLKPMHHMHVSGISTFGMREVTPYRDFHHFKSKLKPWLKKNSQSKHKKGVMRLWFLVLDSASEKYGLNINIEDVAYAKPILGMFPTHAMVMHAQAGREKQRNTQG